MRFLLLASLLILLANACTSSQETEIDTVNEPSPTGTRDEVSQRIAPPTPSESVVESTPRIASSPITTENITESELAKKDSADSSPPGSTEPKQENADTPNSPTPKEFLALRRYDKFPKSAQEAFSGILMAEFLPIKEKAGISIAVYQSGSLWSRTLGQSRKSVLMEVATPMGIHSSAKTFLGALVMTQIEDGLYGLNDQISDLLEEHPGYQSLPSEMLPDITVSELLTMTSGAGHVDNLTSKRFQIMGGLDWAPIDTFSLVGSPTGNHGLLNYNQYTNSFLLGMIAEHLGGSGLHTLYQETFFDPLSIQAVLLPGSTVPEKIAHPHGNRSHYGGSRGFGDLTTIEQFDNVGFVEGQARLSWAGGGLVSTAENMSLWAYELFSVRGSAVSATVRDQILERFSSNQSMVEGSASHYGYHVTRDRLELADGTSVDTYGHPGVGNGTASHLIYVPSLDVAISILSNSELASLKGSCSTQNEPNLSPFDCIARTYLTVIKNLSPSPLAQTNESQNIDLQNLPQIASHNFVDLGPFISISKFRSAYGHDYTVADEEHDPTGTSCQSMKHYFDAYTLEQRWSGNFGSYDTKGSVKFYAPVSGTIRDIIKKPISGGMEYQFSIVSQEYPSIYFDFFHTELLSELRQGGAVTAGQHLGTIARPHGQAEIAVYVLLSNGKLKYVSFFDVISPEVFDQYKQRGITARSELIISKPDRDSNPIPCHRGGSQNENFIHVGDPESFDRWQRGPDNWMDLS